MANVEQFLNESRTLALRVMESTADLLHGSEEQLRTRRAALGAGWDHLAEGAGRALATTGVEDASLLQQLRRGANPPEKSVSATPDTDLTRMGECFAAVADLSGGLSAPERAQVRDHILTTLSHTARAVGSSQLPATAPGETRAQRLDDLAVSIDLQRTERPLNHLDERSALTGVPQGGLEDALNRWAVVARERLTPSGAASSTHAIQAIAETSAVVAAAARRAALTQPGQAAADLSARWTEHARAWMQVDVEWKSPPPVLGGRPDAGLLAASRHLQTVLGREFRDHQNRWVSPDRLADPAALRRFEYQARNVMTDLSARYAQAVSSAATSEVLAIPATALTRPDGNKGVDSARRFGGRAWVTLPMHDPAAVRLVDATRAVDASGIKLTRPGPPAERSRPGSLSAVTERPDRSLRAPVKGPETGRD